MSGPRMVEQWREYLTEYSAEMLRLSDEDQQYQVGDAQRVAGWLGAEGADEERLTALEERLGTRLPPSFRSFLGASDGWLTLGPAGWQMRTTDTIGRLREEEPWLWETAREFRGARLADHALLISVVEDQDDWLLDPTDVSEDGEWAAYRTVAFETERYASFAALIVAERRALEERAGAGGRPLHPEGAEDLVAEGRAQALRGEVSTAVDTFERAITKGSGAAAYLRVMLEAFLELTDYEPGKRFYFEKIFRGVFENAHVMEAIGKEQVRAEAAALVLRGQSDAVPGWREGTHGPFPRGLLADVLPEVVGDPAESDADWAARVDTVVPSPLPEAPVFQRALEAARSLVRAGDTDGAWQVIETALPQWRSDSPYRIAPVVLLTDPVLRRLITPDRARHIATTPRQDG
ncbi:SMI1/KNR4 family protein [Streptomyces sp. NPDC102441]|uniref:SMI1/KNR4 family protein n=1 Tax=Streptomyces sp. NPDC102441 TaxID=3366176 RepID=UPI003829835B